MGNIEISRREFLAASSVAAATLFSHSVFGAPAYIKGLGKPNSLFKGVQIGVISYSWRSLPSSAEQVLQYCKDCNISAIELMGPSAESFAGAPEVPAGARQGRDATEEQRKAFDQYLVSLAEWRAKVSMDKFVQLRKMYNDAGVKIYAYKPSALGAKNTDAEVEYALRATRAMGATHATVELPNDAEESLRLGKIAARNKVYIAYHGHTKQSPTWWDVALSQSDYNAMNLDMGHYVAAGYDPLPFIKERHKHILSMHVKDRKSKANGAANVVWGEGDTPIAASLNLMSKNKYKFPATIELEYAIPEGSDAIKETIRCVEFARKALGA